MLNRSNIALAAVLVFQLVLLAIAVVAVATTENRPIEAILRDLSVAEVDRLTIIDGQDNMVSLARGEDGWVLPDADDFPVNGSEVDDLLEKLASLDTSRLVATNPANFARLEVADDEFQRKISIDHDGKTSVLFLGGSGGGETAYARLEGENQVYLGSGIYAWSASAQVSGWIDTSYVNVPQADIQNISVSNANGDFTFIRDGESWTYIELAEGETFDDTKIPSILRNVATLRMLEPLGRTALDEYGLAEPAATVAVHYRQLVESETDEDGGDADEASEAEDVEIEYAAEHSYTLTFGIVQEDGNVAVKSSDNAYYVSARESTAAVFADLSHDDLVEAIEPEADDSTEDAG